MFAGLALFLPALAQNSSDNLPAAPSATAQQEQQNAAAAAAAAKKKIDAQPDPAQQAPTPAAPQNALQQKDNAASASESQPTKPAVDGSLLDYSSSPAATIVHRVDEVNLVFTVTDRHGRYINDMTKQDFSVLDDDRPGNLIRSFQNETDLPLEVGLLIDASNSIRDRFQFEQQSAVEFLNTTIRQKYDKAFVLGFDVTPDVTQDFTDNTELLSKGIRVLRPGGGTALFDALYYACRDKLMKAPQTGPVRKAIILLTDGDDNQSHVTREEAIEMAQRAEVTVYTISTNLTGNGGEGDKVLQRIAEATGGRSYTPFQLTDVADAFGKIQEELRSQYALSYRPAILDHDGGFHTVTILAKNRKGIRVHARPGYYAPTE
jgi:Ca-activated chloride channel homolog